MKNLLNGKEGEATVVINIKQLTGNLVIEANNKQLSDELVEWLKRGFAEEIAEKKRFEEKFRSILSGRRFERQSADAPHGE